MQERLIQAFPKVELHVHVEAFLSVARVEQLAREAGVTLPRPADRFYEFDSLADFLDLFAWLCRLLNRVEIAEQLGYDAAVQLSGDGVVYAELYVGPTYWASMSPIEVVTSLAAGLDRAHRDGYADCRILPALVRDEPVEWAFDLIDWVASDRTARVVGLGLEGNEAAVGRSSARFAEVYEHAAPAGLGRTVHAGESSGPEGVWDALDLLGVDRIDHGVRAIEDPVLVERLAAEAVTLNVCPTSNVLTGLYRSVADHPVGRLIAAGVPVTINSDDPQPMSVTLSGELLAVATELDWTIEDLTAATRRAIDAAFCSADTASALHAEVDQFVHSRGSDTSA